MMAASETNRMDDVHVVATSKIEEEETFSFLWEIGNYSKISAKEEMVILKSGIMRGGPRSNHSWQLRAIFTHTVDDNSYLALFLELVDFGNDSGPSANTRNRKLPLKFQFSLLDGKSDIPGNSLNCVHKMPKGSDWGYSKMCRSDIIAKRFLKNDTLRVHCQITIEGKRITRIEEQKGVFLTQRKHHQRQIQLERLFTESILTDLVVRGPTRTFAAHKAILAGSSPVFQAMFTNKMSEQQTDCLSITDFEDDIVNAMLEHIYKGETDLKDVQKTSQLLVVANKYDLKILKEDCERRIMEKMEITVELAVDHLVLAHNSNSETLKAPVIHFIKRNLNAVKATDAYKTLVKSPMATILLDLL